MESEFEFPALLKLTRPQMDFIEVFVKNRGVIREVERELGCSYPTVRAKLDEVVAAMGFAPRGESDESDGDESASRRSILDDLRAGRVSPEDALRLLRTGSKRAGSSEEKKDG
jgi:hypothetical protein